MSEATGLGGARGSAGAPEDELAGWPEREPELSIDDREQAGPDTDVHGRSTSPNDDIQGMSTALNNDIQGMSYEQARDALVAVVDELERGGTTLEQSLALWERGEALAARCESWLTGARARLEAARAGAQSRSSG
jgi:exodeoxyribonuclease VII small subunit